MQKGKQPRGLGDERNRFNPKEIGVGEDYCIPPTFRDEHQFNVTYFEPQNRHGISHRLIRLDSVAPPRGSAYLSPLITGLFRSPTGGGYLPLQSISLIEI